MYYENYKILGKKWVIQEVFNIAWNVNLEIMDSCQKYRDIHKRPDFFLVNKI